MDTGKRPRNAPCATNRRNFNAIAEAGYFIYNVIEKGGKAMPTLDMIQQAVLQAVTEYPVKRVELFGSYANGTADADSDVDFLVEFAENPTSLVQICGLRETLSELLHLDVDIVKLPRRPDDGMTIERTVPMYGT